MSAPTPARSTMLALAVVHGLNPDVRGRLRVKHEGSGRRSLTLETFLEALAAATGYTDRRHAWWEVHGTSLTTRLRPWTITDEDRDRLIDLTLTALMAADDVTPYYARFSLEHDVEEVQAVVLRALSFLAGADNFDSAAVTA